MHSACDIEGHIGTDGKYYLLDFARSFPPESTPAVPHLQVLMNNDTRVSVGLPAGAGASANNTPERGASPAGAGPGTGAEAGASAGEG
ncbi:unnamed protein product, partial [Discosporangium mesarthrocarpum]